MATARQIESNRRNASGPHQMSEAGKQAIRGNAIRHGLATRIHVVLPGEDQSFYNEILESLQTEYAPASPQEEMLVHRIAANYWRLIRAGNMETGSLKLGLETLSKEFGTTTAETDDLNRGVKLAMAITKHESLFSHVNRYETTAERSYYRAIRELQKLIQGRGRNGVEAPAAQVSVSTCVHSEVETLVQEQEPIPTPEIRSVPQSTPPAPSSTPEIRSVRQYTLADIEYARLTMSPAELDAFIFQITAPPTGPDFMTASEFCQSRGH